MKDIARRFYQNPLISPTNVEPSQSGFEVTCVLNPGVFRIGDEVYLLVRVAERPLQKEGYLSFPILKLDGTTDIVQIKADHTELITTDPRVIRYGGKDYLTTLSHLRLFKSTDGVNFKDMKIFLNGQGYLETFGVEDCRVSKIGDIFYLTYTAVSANGVAVGLRTTVDWLDFQNIGLILPPHNKDCAIFEEKIDGLFYCLHRPSSPSLGGNFIWLASSYDASHWGQHKCILQTRPGFWDSVRVGAGASPIKTAKGWLVLYHGADEHHRYGLGVALLSLTDPSIVISRAEKPVMVPTTSYEINGFFGEVVFTNGHYVASDGDTLVVYYGAADETICGAKFSISQLLSLLKT